jgi:hypothetical protein
VTAGASRREYQQDERVKARQTQKSATIYHE